MLDRPSPRPSSRRPAVLRLVAFLIAAVVITLAAVPVAGLVAGLAGSSSAPWPYGVFCSVALLAATWVALRRDGESLHALGLVPSRRRVAEFAGGFAASGALFAVVAVVRAASVGAGWTFDPADGLRAALVGLPVTFAVMLWEELFFRGYAFRKAEALWGAPAALALSSLVFGAYHVVGSGYWGMGAFFLFAMPTLGGLVFGLAALRTRGLALPIGLHFGANWVNASVLGLGVPAGSALWAAPVDAAQAAALTAPDLLPHLPYIAAVVLLAAAVRAWPGRPRRVLA